MDPVSFLHGRSRETAIRRDAEGRWFHEHEPLVHPGLARAFDRWIERTEDGRYCLKNEINWAYITLEGAPYFVRSLKILSGGTVRLTLSDGSEEELDPSTLRQDRAGVLYCDVHRGSDGSMVARFDRHVAGGLLELLDEDDAGVYLTIAGRTVRPPLVDDPLRSLSENKPQ